MRRIAAGILMLLLGLAAAGTARADHPFSFLRRHHDCNDAACGHKLWPFGGHKLLGGHCGHPFHKGLLGCEYHPWFNTYKHGPGPEAAFPHHPFVRGPRDFFMYEW